MVGLLKLGLGLRCSTGVANAQLRTLNAHVGEMLRGASSVLPVQLAACSDQHGGVSSFGYSGTIAHALLRHFSISHHRHTSLSLLFERIKLHWLPFCCEPPVTSVAASYSSHNLELHLARPGSVGHLIVRQQSTQT
eukprot:4287636-Prymnesium_polylepis.1